MPCIRSTVWPAVKAPAQKSAEPLLALQGVTKRFGSLLALSDASLDIMPGEVHCILGENGAGKSTLCNLIFGVHLPGPGHHALRRASRIGRRARGRAAPAASPWCTSISVWCTT